MLFSNGYPYYDASRLLSASALALNPAVITVKISGLQDSFDQPYRSDVYRPDFGNPYRTFNVQKSLSNPDGLSLLPFPSTPHEAAHGVYEYAGQSETPTSIDLRYGGRGFAALSRTEPEVHAYAPSSSGAEIAVTLSRVADPIDGSFSSHWEVASVSVTAGQGSGYAPNQEILIIPNEGSICASRAVVSMKTGRMAPTLSVGLQSMSSCNCSFPGAGLGTGAAFKINYDTRGTTPQTWRVASVDVQAGGRDYADGVPLIFSAGRDDTIESFPAASISVTDGAITGVTVTQGGVAYKSGVPTGVVQISGKGAYYKEDASLSPYLYASDLAKWGLTVDSNVKSETFGHVTAATVAAHPVPETKAVSRCDNACLEPLNTTLVLSVADAGVLGSPGFSPLHRAVSLCVSSPIGAGGALRVVPPAGYDNKAVGITDVAVEAAGFGYARYARVQPSPTFSATPGSGATFSYTLREESDEFGEPWWFISSASVSGGTGYRDNTQLTAANSGAGLQLRLRTKRTAPTLAVNPCPGGSGAEFEVTLSGTDSQSPVWSISRLRVVRGGSGYSGVVPLRFTVSGVQVRAACALAVAGGDGSIVRVRVIDTGAYYADTGVPDRIDIVTSGPFYRESLTQPGFVPPVTVSVSQNWPFSNGDGAKISAVVDSDPASPAFGKLVGATIDSEGSGYVLWSAGQHPTTGNTSPSGHLLPLPIGSTRIEGDADSICTYELLCNPDTAAPTTLGGLIALDRGVRLTVYMTGPGAGGVRSATAVIYTTGYGVEGGFRQAYPEPGFYCVRAFYGSASGDEITLSPLDGRGGSVTIYLHGDPANRSNICSCCDVKDVNCAPPPRLSETSGDQFSSIQQPELPFAQCRDENGNVIDGAWVQLAPTYDEAGDFLEWIVVCGECPEGSVVSPLQEFPQQPRQKTWCSCDDTFEKFCYWKATFDPQVVPNYFAPSDCTTGVELDFSECTNPLP